jgi:hypothetical protein
VTLSLALEPLVFPPQQVEQEIGRAPAGGGLDFGQQPLGS